MARRRWRDPANDDEQADGQHWYEPQADLFGRPIPPRRVDVGRAPRYVIYGFDSLIPEPQSPPERSRLHWLRRLFVDVDGLRSLNTEHGHRAGDRALQIVGRS